MDKGLILSADELSEFEKEIASLGITEDNQLPETSSSLQNNGELSLSEERAWMLHQQDPLSAAGPFSAAFKLTGNIDTTRLTTALKALYKGDSNLNQVYKLDDTGELVKQHLDGNSIEVASVPVDSEEAAINFLLERQNTPMDLATQPSITFWLLPISEQEMVLGILGHHILLDDSAWSPIFTALNAFYNGVDLPKGSSTGAQSAPQNTDKMEQHWAENHADGFTRTEFPALFFMGELSQPAVHSIGSKAISSVPVRASRFYTRIATDKFNALGDAAQSSPFQAALALFGLYLNQLLNKEVIDLVIPVVDHAEITQLNQIGSSSNVIPIRIANTDQAVTSAIVELRNSLLNGLGNNLPIEQIFSVTKTRRNSHPNILVTQVDESSDYLALEEIQAESLAIPPLASDYDLTLAILFEADGQAKIELTTGNDLSPTIGAFLLEQFVAFIDKAEADSKQVIPSLFAAAANSQEVASAASTAPSTTPASSGKQTIVDSILAEFKAVLELDNISEQDDFFELGGHSLLATRVIGKLKTNHNIEVRIADFFNSSTAVGLADFAQHTEVELDEVASIEEDKEIIAPHSLVQLSYMELVEMGRNPIFNIPFALKFSAPLDEVLFQKALHDCLVRHHALRTLLLVNEGEEVMQRVITTKALQDYQWFLPSSTQGEKTAQELLLEESYYSFDLVNELPLRARFFYDEKGVQYLSLLIYHSAFDEWSTGILMNDLFHAYRNYLSGKTPSWEKPAVQYHQHTTEQRQSYDVEKNLAYWKEHLGEMAPAKPIFYQEGDELEASAEGAWIEMSFERATADALNQLAQANKSSTFHAVYSAISLALYYLGAGKKLLVGTSAYGRDDPRYQDTVGLFTNVIMNQVKFDESLSLNQLITKVKDDIIAGLPYSEVPFVTVEETLANPPFESPLDNLCEVYIQFHQKNVMNTAIDLGNGKSVDFELLEPERDIAKFGLHFEAFEDPNSDDAAFRIIVTYRTSNYSDEQIALIQKATEAVIHILTDSVNQPDITLREIRKTLATKGL